jgi:acetyl esterase
MTTDARTGTDALFVDLVSGEPIDDRLDPQAREIAVGAARGGGLPVAMAAKRAAFDEVFVGLSGRAEPLHEVTDQQVVWHGGSVGVRLYRPSAGVLPALVYAHGGGFEKGSLTSHDALCRRLANDAGTVVVAVDYALAPEAGYPTQPDQVLAVLRWVADSAAALRVDPARLAVGGDSVGGNLAAVTAQRARDEGGPALAFQLLFYPVTDLALATDSWDRFADGPWLSRDYERRALVEQYVAGATGIDQPSVSPLRGHLAGLPPAFVADAEFDGYRDEGQAYARRLREAGVDADARVYPGMVHDFALMAGKVDTSRRLLRDAAAALRAALGTGPQHAGAG